MKVLGTFQVVPFSPNSGQASVFRVVVPFCVLAWIARVRETLNPTTLNPNPEEAYVTETLSEDFQARLVTLLAKIFPFSSHAKCF